MARTDSPLTSVMLGMEQAEGLDNAVEAARPLVDAIGDRPALRDALQGRWLGHALHPAVVQFPLGTWISASVLDLLGPDDGGRAARCLVGAGILGAVPAALTGVAEIHEAPRPAKRVGAAHALTNTAALTMQVGSWIARGAGSHGAGRILSLAAVAVASWGGLMGGHLAIGRNIGTRDSALEARPLEEPAPTVPAGHP